MKYALILHAWQNGPDAHWYPWLKNELEARGYTVYLPELPTMNTMSPDLNTQMDFIEQTIPLNKDLVVFGHSLGTLLALRLAEKHTFSKLFLVSGWDFDDLTVEHASYWPNKLNHKAIKQNVKEIYVTSSENDPYMTEFSMEEMSKRLNAKYIFIKGAGHFTEKFGITQIPQLLAFV
jgi:predicted alpha/beta hydrolase family esterase